VKKILYYLPFILCLIFYGFIVLTDFESLQPEFLIIIVLPLIAGLLLSNNKWFGSIIGLTLGVILIYMGSKETGQIINESIFGFITILYYVICGVVCYKSNK